MVQTERETGALRGQFARQVAVQASAAAQAESARAQAEQLSRKLAAARAEVRRYQTRMFAFERTLLALKHDNAELEAACEQAWEVQVIPFSIDGYPTGLHNPLFIKPVPGIIQKFPAGHPFQIIIQIKFLTIHFFPSRSFVISRRYLRFFRCNCKYIALV